MSLTNMKYFSIENICIFSKIILQKSCRIRRMKTRQIIMYAGFGMTTEQINVRVSSDLDTTLLKLRYVLIHFHLYVV